MIQFSTLEELASLKDSEELLAKIEKLNDCLAEIGGSIKEPSAIVKAFRNFTIEKGSLQFTLDITIPLHPSKSSRQLLKR